MELRQKLHILADAAKYDASCASSGSKRNRSDGELGNTTGTGICHSYTPDGRCVPLLKILLTNYCIYDCLYCVNRISSDTPRARFLVNEVVRLTMEFYKRNYIEGLFLSSGILRSPDYTSELMSSVAKRLRTEESFAGYIHLKAAPGTSQAILDEMSRWCDRISANIELPTEDDLEKIAPAKTHAAVEATMQNLKSSIFVRRDEQKFAKKKRSNRTRFGARSQSTQLIVGATKANDYQILHKASLLYRSYGLSRVYYSAFSPKPFADPILPSRAAPLVREHRLYQADWLQRFYGFSVDEIISEKESLLDLNVDPKLSWALRNRQFFPVHINRATKEALLRVPGFGKSAVQKIIQARKFAQLRMSDLKNMRVSLNRAKYFITTVDPNPFVHQLDSSRLYERLVEAPKTQLSLPFAAALTSAQNAVHALTGEL